MSKHVGAAALFFSVIAIGVSANAQASFDVQLFRPSPHSDSFVTVESGSVAKSLEVRAQIYFNYAYRPLSLYRTSGERLFGLDHRLDMNIAGSISLFDRLSIALQIPATLYQSSTFPSARTPDFKAVAFGDLRLEPKVSLLDAARHYIDLAILLGLSLPTASSGSFAGDRSVTFNGELDVSRLFGPFRAAINFGFLIRGRDSVYYDLRMSHELYARVGTGLDLTWFSKKVPIELIAELYGRTSAVTPFVQAAQNPLELLFAARFAIIQQLQLTAGVSTGLLGGYGSPEIRAFLGLTVIPLRARDAASAPVASSEPATTPIALVGDRDRDGVLDDVDQCVSVAEDPDGFQDDDGCPEPDNDRDGIPDDADKCRNVAEDLDKVQDEDGCPEEDVDGDGVLDAVDQCPNEAEDKDGFEDGDGCRDLDNDKDGIVDSVDICPNEAEVVNGIDDTDGCPDAGKSLVVVTKDAIEIMEKVQFSSGKAVILPTSYLLLNQVASVLKNQAGIKLVRIEGHTDSDGADQRNMELSQARAYAVRMYLIAQGVAEGRLEAVGYGETKPLASNSTKRGKEQNRRVVFTVVNDPPAAEGPSAEPIKK